MGAMIKRSLYIGILETRFDLFDDIKLKLTNGEIISGQIVDIGDDTITLEDQDWNAFDVFVEDIEDYIED